ncbi:hypothetical protein ACJQWK_11325 [Exserohilum turcicum]
MKALVSQVLHGDGSEQHCNQLLENQDILFDQVRTVLRGDAPLLLESDYNGEEEGEEEGGEQDSDESSEEGQGQGESAIHPPDTIPDPDSETHCEIDSDTESSWKINR